MRPALARPDPARIKAGLKGVAAKRVGLGLPGPGRRAGRPGVGGGGRARRRRPGNRAGGGAAAAAAAGGWPRFFFDLSEVPGRPGDTLSPQSLYLSNYYEREERGVRRLCSVQVEAQGPRHAGGSCPAGHRHWAGHSVLASAPAELRCAT